MKLAIILNPQLDGRNGPYGFCAPVKKELKKADKQLGVPTKESTDMISVTLIPGLNFIPELSWQSLKLNEAVGKEVDRCVRRGVISVKTPVIQEGHQGTETTLDFPDLQDVQDIVNACNDIEFLRRCQLKDSRPQVDAWCSKRIEEINFIKNRAQGQS